MIYTLLTPLYVISVFLFSYGFITYSFAFLNKPLDKNRLKYTFIFFISDCLLMAFYSKLNYGLIANWLFFTIACFIKLLIILKAPVSSSLFLSLNAGICGLSSSLFQKALLSLILNIPLSHLYHSNSYLTPMLLILTFFIFFFLYIYFSKEQQITPVRHLVKAPKHFYYLISTMFILMIYLLLHGILYMNDENSIPLKLWSFLSCTYVSFGFLWSVKYAVRASYLYYLDDKNASLRNILNNYKNEELHLKEASSYDALTNIFNRRAGNKAIDLLIENKKDFCLCIVDLDGLKYVNDNLGHKSGDFYLTTVANILKENCRHKKDILFRYGGDEFVIAFVEIPFEEAQKRMYDIYNNLNDNYNIQDFKMSISFGISPPSDMPLLERVEQADDNMYKMKAIHKAQNPHLVRI